MADEKKERVIHTRIPAALEEQIKRLADNLRVPVSNLVRNMLEDAIDVTRRVTGRSPVEPPAPPPPPADPLASVFGWQALTLNLATSCARCGIELHPGDDAFLGLTDRPGDRHFLCPECLPRRGSKKSNGSHTRKK